MNVIEIIVIKIKGVVEMADYLGNKGEWSEVYVFLYLLAAGHLYAADAELNKIDSTYYNIAKIFRDEDFGNLEFCINKSDAVIYIKMANTENVIATIPMKKFDSYARFLLEHLQSKNKSVFAVPEVESFLKKLHVDKLKAKSVSKSDIHIQIHDIKAGLNLIQGFSIKSRLGAPSTLINASKSTNFIYEVIGQLSVTDIQKINDCKSFTDKFALLNAVNCRLNYLTMENPIFEGNLILIDSFLPQVCAHLLLEYYQGDLSAVDDLLNLIENINPLNYNLTLGHPFYRYKFVKFLSECALGMKPSQAWNGVIDATGGYIIVKENGDVVCYHIFKRNEFEQYLLKNTKFETPSTSKHDFGKIFTDANGRNLMKLNLQVRFTK